MRALFLGMFWFFSVCYASEGQWHFLSSSPLFLYAKTAWSSSVSFYEEHGVRRLVLFPTAPIEDDPRQDYLYPLEKNKYYKIFRKMMGEWGCRQMIQLAPELELDDYALSLCREMEKKGFLVPYELSHFRQITLLVMKREDIDFFIESQRKYCVGPSHLLYLEKLKKALLEISCYPLHLSLEKPLISENILKKIGSFVPRVWIDYFDHKIHLVDHHRIHAALDYGIPIVVDVMPPRTTLN